jgi:hypothetical protein
MLTHPRTKADFSVPGFKFSSGRQKEGAFWEEIEEFVSGVHVREKVMEQTAVTARSVVELESEGCACAWLRYTKTRLLRPMGAKRREKIKIIK